VCVVWCVVCTCILCCSGDSLCFFLCSPPPQYQIYYMQDPLLDDHELFPFCEGTNVSFRSPLPSTHEQYIRHIENTVPADTPLAFGLHPNAEIGYRTFASNDMFETLISLQASTGAGGEDALSPTDIAAAKMEEVRYMNKWFCKVGREKKNADCFFLFLFFVLFSFPSRSSPLFLPLFTLTTPSSVAKWTTCRLT